MAIFSGDPSSQEIGNASAVFDLGSTGFLGVGNINGLDDNNGRLRLLFAEEDEGIGSQICKVEWSPPDIIRLDYTCLLYTSDAADE